ncbi:DUF58 domain-containing protein [Lentzea tibetensis]|uniref:DUF58 domain-containing protein n=1 Tax=Lentzea tibetensis TaxID=2591470 RepID=A0A563ES56_9PSEU|nr:DUF58 domain-containing protein [Lentzea tibetensis]TWP50575.1 DUF58 domain-containing protein [Lentzea tibetensis]
MNRYAPFTASGWAVLAGGVALFALGRLAGYPAAAGLAVAALVLLIFGAVTVVIPQNLELTRGFAPDRVSAGDAAAGRLTVHNKGRRAVGGLVVVDRLADVPVPVPLPVVQAGGWRTAQYPIPARRRGRLELGPLTVERADALGLFRRRQDMGHRGVLWVHPRVHAVQPMPVGTVPDFEGRAEASKPGTTSFASLREYVQGDDPRRIHWRSTARTGQLVVRESVDTMEPTVSVVLDTRSAVFDADIFEEAAEIAATVVSSTLEGGRPARLVILGEDLAEVTASGATSALDRLAAAQRCAGEETADLVTAVDVAEPGGALVVVTGAGEPAVVTRLADQRRRFAPVVVVLMGDGEPFSHRRQGLVVLSARTGAEAASAWNHLVLDGAVG